MSFCGEEDYNTPPGSVGDTLCTTLVHPIIPWASLAAIPFLIAAVGGFELPMEKANKVDAKLKALAETKVALMVGCEFCIDIAAHISTRDGVTEEQLMALPRHREAACYDELERLVRLRDAGALSPAEFEGAKRRLLE